MNARPALHPSRLAPPMAVAAMLAAHGAFADEIWLDEGNIEIALPSGQTFQLQAGQYAKCGNGTCLILPLEDAPVRASAGSEAIIETAETNESSGNQGASRANPLESVLEPPTAASPN